MLFISHANPQDNEFTRWLALRLAKEGYPVWCDLTKLLGGEDFWEEIEFAIRNRTAKFIFVVSRASNHREGPLKELAVAAKVKKEVPNFIVPLRRDDIPFDDFNIELNRSIAINFADGWISGLTQLLQLLERDNVQRSPNFSPDAVTKWWRSNLGESEGLLEKIDIYSSNVIRSDLPQKIYRHRLDGWLPTKFKVSKFEYPVSAYGNVLTSFATADDLEKSISKTDYQIVGSDEFSIVDFLTKGVRGKVEPHVAHNVVVRLLRWSFNAFLLSKGLNSYGMSRGKFAFWFPRGLMRDDKIHFTTPHGAKSWRAMVGYKSLRAKDGAIISKRFWHFAIEGVPIVDRFVGFAIMPHVVFTENGEPYESDRRQHRARRSQCKNWFNNDWLDRIIATLTFLSDEQQMLPVRVASATEISIPSELGTYESPISYVRTIAGVPAPVTEDEYDVDDEEAEDDEEDLVKLQEPRLLFRHNQALEDPRDGLALFGPVDDSAVFGIRAALIGTKEGIKRFSGWVKSIQRPISNDPPVRHRPPFPGFEAAFGIPWHPEPVLAIEIREDDLTSKLHLSDKYHRIFQTVEFFSSKIIQANKDEDVRPDLWFVVIPDEVHKLCRPQSVVAFADRIDVANRMPLKEGRSYRASPSLFEEWNEQAEPYQYEPDFHSQIKARLLRDKILTQIVRESTIAPYDFLNQFGRPIRNLEVLQSEVAWNLSSATYYKAGAKPWKLDGVREGVCYVGLVFKRDEKSKNPSMACCAAQMFLDSGDGVVFKGQLGPWYTNKRGHYHLTVNAASQLLDQAITAYKDLHHGARPAEIFIHGRTRFDEPEWNGFLEAAGSRTQVTGVRIRKANWFRLFRHDSEMPILRGLALVNSNTEAFLATKGFTPRLQTYPGLEVPVPLFVDVCRGKTDIKVVLQDIMGLTKLNYNSCRHSDGLPVTLKFADAIGEILISGPIEGPLPLPFRHYI